MLIVVLCVVHGRAGVCSTSCVSYINHLLPLLPLCSSEPIGPLRPHTAVSVAPPQVWVPPVATTPMERLFEMGFCKRQLNLQLLTQFGNNVDAVVAALLDMEQRPY